MNLKFYSTTGNGTKFKRITTVEIDTGHEIIEGAAACHINDNDDKLLGQKAALTNAVREIPREMRKLIWKEFLNRSRRARDLGGDN